MIRSMTGFGRAEATISEKKMSIEIRTLNSKQLDMTLRIPSVYRAAEFDLRAVLAKGVLRGKCEVFVNVNAESQKAGSIINEMLFEQYCDQIASAFQSAGIKGALTQESALAALKMPDVISAQSDSASSEEVDLVMSLAIEAIKSLNSFREQEGAILIADILARVDKIESLMRAVEPFEQPRIEAIRQRIRDHIAKERIDIDNNRLEAEMIFYVEKLDITEEKVRLKNHCEYFREVSNEEEGVGRKLGFIAQEMGREINTMGSKSNDADMQRLVVQMKDELEKIKEQVLNIL